MVRPAGNTVQELYDTDENPSIAIVMRINSLVLGLYTKGVTHCASYN